MKQSRRLMRIIYPYDEKLKNRLLTCLDMCCAKYAVLCNGAEYEIFIDRGRWTWNQIINEVNRVRPVKIRFVNDCYIKNNKLCQYPLF